MEPEQSAVERTIRSLQLGQLFRSACWAFTNAASTALALRLTNGDHARIVQLISLAGTLSSGLELLLSPWIGLLCDQFGRKPLLVAASMARFVP